MGGDFVQRDPPVADERRPVAVVPVWVQMLAPFKVTVPIDWAPPTTVRGFNPIELNAGGLTVNVADVFTTPL